MPYIYSLPSVGNLSETMRSSNYYIYTVHVCTPSLYHNIITLFVFLRHYKLHIFDTDPHNPLRTI